MDELLQYLKSQRIMSLATSTPWICTVYYAVDDDLNFYFVSSPNSQHCNDIKTNKLVACSIADSHTANSAQKKGVQLQGRASRVEGWGRVKVLLQMWHKAAPGAEKLVNVKNMKNNVISSRLYMVKPTILKFFNQELYGEEESKIFTV